MEPLPGFIWWVLGAVALFWIGVGVVCAVILGRMIRNRETQIPLDYEDWDIKQLDELQEPQGPSQVPARLLRPVEDPPSGPGTYRSRGDR